MHSWSLKKEVFIHVFCALLFFLPFVFFHRLMGTPLALCTLGVLIGTFLPEIDHLIYTLLLKPNELTSQRVQAKVNARDYPAAFWLLFSTRDERRALIFHTIFFQVLFVVFTFFVVTSSASLFGTALSCAFLLSLFIDQLVDIKTKGNLSRWSYQLPFSFTFDQFKLYVLVQGALLLILAYII